MKAMRNVGMAVLAMAAIIAGQTALAGVAGFHTAELIGKTAMTALYLYAMMRIFRAKREARA